MYDESMPNHAEYTVPQKAEGRYLKWRLLLIFLYLLFGFSYTITAFVIGIVQVIAVLPIFLWILVHFTWRYVSLEHSFSISEGTLTVTDILKDGKKRIRHRIVLRDALGISSIPSAIPQGTAVYDYRGDKTADNSYALTYRAGSKDCMLFFRATPDFLKTVKRFVK